MTVQPVLLGYQVGCAQLLAQVARQHDAVKVRPSAGRLSRDGRGVGGRQRVLMLSVVLGDELRAVRQDEDVMVSATRQRHLVTPPQRVGVHAERRLGRRLLDDSLLPLVVGRLEFHHLHGRLPLARHQVEDGHVVREAPGR